MRICMAAIHRKERAMTDQTKDVWINLHAKYLIDPTAEPCDLFDDAELLLKATHGLIHTLNDALTSASYINPHHLTGALTSLGTLIEMSRQCALHARSRMLPASSAGHQPH
jgi:hypothetical protein